MSLPIINYKHKNTEPDIELQELFERKLQSLEKYLGENTDLKIEVEFEHQPGHHDGKLFRLEANVWNDGVLFRADESAQSFELAIDEVRNELDKELRRHRKKKESMYRKGKRAIKNLMKRGTQQGDVELK